jgi:hypothetical protein
MSKTLRGCLGPNLARGLSLGGMRMPRGIQEETMDISYASWRWTMPSTGEYFVIQSPLLQEGFAMNPANDGCWS